MNVNEKAALDRLLRGFIGDVIKLGVDDVLSVEVEIGIDGDDPLAKKVVFQ